MQIPEIRTPFNLITFFQQNDTDRNGRITAGEAEGVDVSAMDSDHDQGVEPWEVMEAVNRSNPTAVFTTENIQQMRDANEHNGTMAYLGVYEGNLESQGVNFHGDLYFTYFSNGQLKQATLTENVTRNGVTYKADSIIIFNENGAVERGMLAERSDINGIFYQAGTRVLFQDGVVIEGVLDQDDPINGKKYQPGTQILFYSDGQVKQGTLAAGNEINGISYPAGSVVYFDEQGRLTKVVISEEVIVSGNHFAADSDLNFYPSGQLASGTLASNTEIHGAIYKEGTLIEFFANGSVKSGTLAESAEVGDEEYWEDSVITFNEAGEVTDGDVTDERYLRLQLQFPISVAGGVSWFNFRELGEETLTVPPHSDDDGSTTAPVDTTWTTSLESQFNVDLMVDFWQYVYLRYRFGMVFKTDGLSDNNMDPQTHPYTSGDPNSTFVQLQNIDDGISYHYLALGTNLISHNIGSTDSSGNVAWSLELGAERQSYELVRGWVRNGQTEELDRNRFDMWGVALGTELRVTSFTNAGFWGISFGINAAYFPDYGYNLMGTFGIPMGFKLFEK